MLGRVLYLTYDGLTDPLGQSQVLPYLIGLSRKGYDITVISCEKPDRFVRNRAKIEKICADAGLRWEPLPYTKSPPVVSTLADLRRMRDKAEELHKRQPFQLIHCRSYLPVLIALGFKKKFGLPYIFDMRGFWADERVEGDIWDLKNPVHRRVYEFFKKRESLFLEQAAAIVSLTEAAKRDIIDRFISDPLFGGGPLHYNYDRAVQVEQKIIVTPCSVDTELFNPNIVSKGKKQWLAAKYGLDIDGKYLGYLGSLGTWYMGEEMVRLYSVLHRRDPELRFLVLSHDNPDQWMRFFKKYAIPVSNMIHIEANRNEIPVFIHFMIASVFFYRPTYSKKATSPTKQGELMAMGIPVICNTGVGDTEEIVQKYRSGYVTKGFSNEDFETIADHWKEIIHLNKDHIRRGALEFYDLDKGVNRYASIYENILAENHSIDPVQSPNSHQSYE